MSNKFKIFIFLLVAAIFFTKFGDFITVYAQDSIDPNSVTPSSTPYSKYDYLFIAACVGFLLGCGYLLAINYGVSSGTSVNAPAQIQSLVSNPPAVPTPPVPVIDAPVIDASVINPSVVNPAVINPSVVKPFAIDFSTIDYSKINPHVFPGFTMVDNLPYVAVRVSVDSEVLVPFEQYYSWHHATLTQYMAGSYIGTQMGFPF